MFRCFSIKFHGDELHHERIRNEVVDFILSNDELMELVDGQEVEEMRSTLFNPGVLLVLALAMKYHLHLSLIDEYEVFHHQYGMERVFVVCRFGVWNVLNYIPQFNG